MATTFFMNRIVSLTSGNPRSNRLNMARNRVFKQRYDFIVVLYRFHSLIISLFRAAIYEGIRSKGIVAPRKSKPHNFVKQIKALVASKTRDAANVLRATAALTVTTSSCLTSSTDFLTAASGTGLLEVDGDEALINSVRMAGVWKNNAELLVDPDNNSDIVVRKLVVWFNKPLLVASAAGTLPPITEVLMADSIDAMEVTSAANGGRFVLLSDERWNLGTNTFQAATALGHARVQGQSTQYYDYIVPVDMKCKFAANGVSAAPSGHYDSDVSAGRIDKGLLICYTQIRADTNFTVLDTMTSRLNYTG